MDNNINDSGNNRTDNFYILKGFTYGPQDPNSLEEARIPGVTIKATGPKDTTLISDSSGNFSSGLLPEGKYKLSFFDPSGKYYTIPISIYLGSDSPRPVYLYILRD